MPASLRRTRLGFAVIGALLAGSACADDRETWYPSALNHRDAGLTVLVVRRDDGRDWIRGLDLKLLGLPVPAGASGSHQGERIVPLDSVPRARLDPLAQRIAFFDARHRDGRTPVPGNATDSIADVVVNHQPLREPQIIKYLDGRVWLSADAARAARLRVDRGAAWVDLHAIAGEDYVLDPERLRLEFTAPPERFNDTRVSIDAKPPLRPGELAPAPLSAILGYDFSTGRQTRGDGWHALLLDGTLSAGRGLCRSRHLARDGDAWERLDSQCIFDWPARRLSLTLGDALTREAALSAPVRYGGFRIGTDFSLQPQLQLQPLLGIEGSARLPSVLEVWVEQQLALRTEVAPGEFAIDGIPAMTGRGEIDAVIIDALGRRTVVSAPFYSAPTLLRPGLSDWALEAGRLRVGFLGADEHYADAFGRFSWRRGLTPWWTARARVEALEDSGVAGVGSNIRLGVYGVAELAVARSRRGGIRGKAFAAGWHYQGGRWSLGLRHERHSSGYRDLAFPEPGTAPLRETRLSGGLRLGRASLSLGGHQRETAREGRRRFARAGLDMPLGAGYLSLSAFAPLDDEGQPLYTATYTLSLDPERSMSVWLRQQDDGLRPGATLQRNLPAGLGHGYRITHEGLDGDGFSSLAASYRGRRARIDADVLHNRHGTNARLSASGALIATGSGLFLSRDSDSSFALVTLPDAGVPIYREHQLAAVTDADGRAVVPRLRPYQRNRLSLGTGDVPLSTRIGLAELELVPGRRQVVSADFQAIRIQPVALRLVRADGSLVPTGAVALLQPGGTRVPVGYDGLLYLELTGTPESIRVLRQGLPLCRIDVDAIPEQPDAAAIHDVTCQEMADAP